MKKCGFFIFEIYFFLGVSFDDIIEKGCLVEIKKVILKDIFFRIGIYKRNNENIILKRNYKYFY